jgi:hypothetical protein
MANIPPTDTLGRPSRDQEKLAEAKRRVGVIKGFYIHFAVFVLVIVGLLGIDFAMGGPRWVHWVFMGWGIGVLAHALAVLGGGSRWIADWEKRKIEQLMNRR